MGVKSFLDVEKIVKFITQLAAIYEWAIGHNLWTLDTKETRWPCNKENELNISALNLNYSYISV